MARIIFLIFFLLFFLQAYPQSYKTVIKGHVSDKDDQPVSLVNINIKGSNYGTFTSDDGSYILSFPADNETHILVFSSIGYAKQELTITADTGTLIINVRLKDDITVLRDITVRKYREKGTPSLKNIPLEDINLLPAASGSMEKLLVSLPGVSSNNELSNQYTVRGGNYDENLVYVNDIEVYRPVLIKTGRQEGLSFLNQDLIRNVRFSPGGFDASFGDRMSSVLDIKYKEPSERKASLKTGLLTNSAHIEGSTNNNRFRYLAGTRYKTNQLLLQTLDTKANYKPAFFDIQSLLSYDISEKAEISFMSSYSSNRYSFVPASRRSSFGSLAEAYQLYVHYRGSETDRYRSFNLALSFDLETQPGADHKFIAHYYKAAEEENYDIRGSYALNMIDKNLGSENSGDSIMNIGSGSWLSHARNQLAFTIYTLNYKGRQEISNNTLNWGLKYSHESNKDKIRQWKKIDSAGYSLPLR